MRVGDVLALKRREVTIEPLEEYSLIGVYSFGKGILHREPTRGADLGDYRFFRVEPGDLVLSNIQAWEGAIAHATPVDDGTIGTHRFLTYVPIDSRIDTSWARWFFLSEPGIRLIRRAAPGTAVRNRTLAIDRFEALELRLPSLDEQRATAARIERVQMNVDAISDRLDQVRTLANAAAVAITSIQAVATHARAAQGWRSMPLRSLMRPSLRRVSVDPSHDYRLAGVYSFGRGLIDRGVISGSATSYREFTLLQMDDVVVSKLNGWEGAIAVVDSAFAGAHVSTEFPTFALDANQVDPCFFRALARAPAFWATLNSTTRGSMVRRRRISTDDFLRTEVCIPDLPTQIAAAQRLGKLDRVRVAHDKSRQLVTAALPALLNELFGT